MGFPRGRRVPTGGADHEAGASGPRSIADSTRLGTAQFGRFFSAAR